MRDERLYEAKKFFTLPEVSFATPRITHIESRYQPTGFSDENGVYWSAVMHGGVLKRQRM